MTNLMINFFTPAHIFYTLLIITLILSIRPKKDDDFFSVASSQELKGLAILTIIFAHLIYGLLNGPNFLEPLSNMAGLGVNLFLFLSGYGLAATSLRNSLSLWQFYKKRLPKLLIPFWFILALILGADILFLGYNYDLTFIVKAFFGIFTHADLYQDFNSPLWYFTFILAYYLLFPWLFSKKRPYVSAIALYAISYLLVYFAPSSLNHVIHLYRMHLIAFPLGLLVASYSEREDLSQKLSAWLKKIRLKKVPVLYFSLSSLILFLAYYFSINSGVGGPQQIEELISVLATVLFFLLFSFKSFKIRALYYLGFFSYEIYLFHWPLLYRYDFIFKYLNPYLSAFIYLFVFIGVAFIFQNIIKFISYKKSNIK